MSDADYLKCACQKCGGHIKFPSNGVGETVDCPHCGKQTKLISTPEKSTAKPKSTIVAGLILVIFILVAAVVMFCWSKMLRSIIRPPPAEPLAVTNAVPKAFTELNDFKIGKITLKKTEGSGLVYAVGTVKNDTTRQRFGVKIELDLLDAQEAKIGSVSDYIAVLEPHKEWQFKALLTDPKAVKAKFTNIEEQK